MWQSVSLVACGAILGATARWGLNLILDPLLEFLSLGTLVANLLGCFIIGMLLAIFWQFPQISNEWRLFLMTGFLGSFTTFSSFSAEVIENFLSEKWLTVFSLISIHLVGGIFFTMFGLFFCRILLK
ncbi:fluoride efflux transporter CrcB [Seminibacterium arietis]|uniref:Fluoride-specific ion channel FluC n=1 Tax=Seminibacterium arietis TaxID=1173502 RepID=A0ABW3I6Z6_9PAST